MKLLLTAVAAVFLSASCATTREGGCAFDIDRSEWKIVPADPTLPIKKYLSERGRKWYSDQSGNLLICLNEAPDYTCGGNWTTYVKREDNTYEEDDFVVCTE